jgi:hypothetical protein
MSIKKIIISNATAFHFCGHVGLISKYKSGVLKASMFPIPVLIHDPETNLEYEANLVSVVAFDHHVIPESFSRIFEGKTPEEAAPEIMARCQVKNINELGFYLYAYNR